MIPAVPNLNRLFRHTIAFCVLATALLWPVSIKTAANEAHSTGLSENADNPVPVVTVSAASFEVAAIGPESIAAAFGTLLATGVVIADTIPLPTALGGTTVKVKDSAGTERLAELFFVSPNQVNYLIPSQTATGTAMVTITSGDGTISTGTIEVKSIAPAVFSANSDGQGVPAAVALRVKGDGTQVIETISIFDSVSMRFITKPINLGPPEERVFLILFGSGIRGAADPNGDGNYQESVSILIGGDQFGVAYAGAQGAFVGLDQFNIELSRSLIGRGKVNASVAVMGGSASNLLEIEIAGPPGPSPPQISGFSQSPVLAGQMMNIVGTGFSPTPEDNVVRIGGVEADVISSSAGQLTVQVPFGVNTGTVSVTTSMGEGISASILNVRTSISGLIETTSRDPVPGVKMKVAGTSFEGVTGPDGNFIIPDVPPGVHFLEPDTSTLPPNLPFPMYSPKVSVSANRDNPLSSPLQLQPSTGPSINVGGGGGGFTSGFTSGLNLHTLMKLQNAPQSSVETGGVIFEVPDDVSAVFPDGSTSGKLTLTIVENSRLPVQLPPGVFSSTIVQITPFGTMLSPGGKLTFPNADKLMAGSQASLYILDQDKTSHTYGQFIVAGPALVSADGSTVQTEQNAVKKTSYFFTARLRPTTTLIGRVVDSDGETPARKAIVSSRGQESFTDGNGGFVLRNVPVDDNKDLLKVEASLLRPNGRVDRVERRDIVPNVNGVTKVSPALVLPSRRSNRPPSVIAEKKLTVTEGITLDTKIIVNDPDQDQTVNVSVSGANFAAIMAAEKNVYILRLTPGRGTAGSYTLKITATDNLGAKDEKDIALTVLANSAPSLTVPSISSLLPGQPLNIIISAIDPDLGQLLTFTASGLPQGSGFNQETNTTARFNWTPSSSQTGNFTVTFKVTDNGLNSLSDSRDVTINVSPVPQWQMTSGPTGGIITALYSDGEGIYAGTFGAGVFRSFNGGGTWENVLQTCEIKEIVGNQQAIFAGTWDCGMFRSTDQGKTWIAINKGLSGPITSARISGSDLYAGNFSGDIFVSKDSGDNWSKLTNVTPNSEITAIAMRGNDLFAGTHAGVFRSTDLGTTWKQLNEGLASLSVNDFAVAGNRIIAGTESGAHILSENNQWLAVNTGLNNLSIIDFAVAGNVIYAGTGNGVFITTNLGLTWAPIVERSILGDIILSLVVHQGDVYAGTNGNGIFRWSNLWFSVNDTVKAQVINDMAVRGNELFAGTRAGGVFRSIDQGLRWQSISKGLTFQGAQALLVNGDELFAGADGVMRFDDKDQTWVPSDAGFGKNKDVTSLVAANNAIYAGTFGGGIYKSSDNGRNWQAANNGLSELTVLTLYVNGSEILAGTLAGLFTSKDNGGSWQFHRFEIENPAVLAIVFNGKYLLAATPRGIYRSTGNGNDWKLVSRITAITLAASGQTLFAGTFVGAHISIDGGISWAPAGDGLMNNKVLSFEVTPELIFVGTGGSVYSAENKFQ